MPSKQDDSQHDKHANGHELGTKYSATMQDSHKLAENIVEPPFARLNIKANYRYYDVPLHQPAIQTPRADQ